MRSLMVLTRLFSRMDKLALEKLLQCLGLIGMIASVEDTKTLWANCFLQVMVLSLRERAHE